MSDARAAELERRVARLQLEIDRTTVHLSRAQLAHPRQAEQLGMGAEDEDAADAWAARAELGRQVAESFHEGHAKIRAALAAERARVAHARESERRAAAAAHAGARGGLTLNGVRIHDTVGEVKARIAAFGELDADLAPSDLRLRLDGVELLDDGAKLSACGAAAPDALSRLDVVVRAAPLPVEAGGEPETQARLAQAKLVEKLAALDEVAATLYS